MSRRRRPEKGLRSRRPRSVFSPPDEQRYTSPYATCKGFGNSHKFTKGLVGWFLQVLLLKRLLYSIGSGEAPLLDIVVYAGYAFTGHVFCYPYKIFVELFILLPVAMDVCLYGGVPGEDYEKGSFRGAEKTREALKQASLSLDLHGCLSSPCCSGLAMSVPDTSSPLLAQWNQYCD